MFEDYLATNEDFDAIEEALGFVWKKELDFIFKNKKLIKNVIVISYDCKNLYLWSKVSIPKLNILSIKKNGYNFYKIPHKIKIEDKDQRGWRVGFCIGEKEINKYLPKEILKGNYWYPKIIGSLLKPFTESHNKKISAYYTRESYLATIVHEFGHIYFNQSKTWWFSSKKENLNYLETSLRLYSDKEKSKNIDLCFPNYFGLSELFAFCTDYTASIIFWPNHKNDIDRINRKFILKKIKEENNKDMDVENSVLDGFDGPHLLALVFGKILVEYSPNLWPKKILLIKNHIRLNLK